MLPISRQVQVKTGPNRATGFSLVEIMVGMVIGLLGILIMMNIYSNFEGQKRTTSGAGDVQNEGAIALFSLQRDIEQAGYDINSTNLLGCRVSVPAITAPVAFILPAIAPVTINSSLIPASGVDANTDTLLIVYGSSNGQPEGDIISSLAASAVQATQYNVKFQPPSAQAGDQVIFEPVARPAPCNLSVDSVTTVNQASINVANGMPTASIPIVPNNIGTVFNLGNAANAANGNAFTVNGYAIRGGNLTACNYMQTDCTNVANWSAIANGIVSLKAQYGRDTAPAAAMDSIVDVYDQTTPSSANPTYACDWMRISSMRVALIGRNGQPDKGIVTGAAPIWAGSVGNPIDLSAFATWQNYRYKVFETTIPIRNLALNGVVPGC